MTDESSTPPSLRKDGGKNGRADTSGLPTPPAAGTPDNPRPRPVTLACGALVLSGLAAVGAAASLSGEKDWLRRSGRDAINNNVDDNFTQLGKTAFGKSRSGDLSSLQDDIKALPAGKSADLTRLHDQVDSLKKATSKTAADRLGDIGKQLDSLRDLPGQVDTTAKSQVVATIVVLLAMSFVALAAYKGRSWARWGVVGLWALATLSGTMSGLMSIGYIGGDIPIAFKVPAVASAVLFIAAVVLVNLRPSVAFFNRNKPVRPDGAPARRGLFAPPAPRPPRGGAATTAGSDRAVRTDRGRAKQRANTEAVAKGAELARSRAKASKSRRTGS